MPARFPPVRGLPVRGKDPGQTQRIVKNNKGAGARARFSLSCVSVLFPCALGNRPRGERRSAIKQLQSRQVFLPGLFLYMFQLCEESAKQFAKSSYSIENGRKSYHIIFQVKKLVV